MNRAILIVLAPALLIGLIYWGIGMRPAPRAIIGMVLFLAAAFYFVRKSKKSEVRN
ncbi:MAG: hypothetical protein HY046_09000 [Acidobacteria bacterium]|nr:hypothetical protein [Acidobacteriota bacterium]